MRVQIIVVGPFEVNCYLYWDAQSRDTVIIDPGGDEDSILQFIAVTELKPLAILLTHGHGDHIAAVGALKEKFRVPLCVGDGDKEMLTRPSEFVSAFYGRPVSSPPADKIVTDGQVLSFGSISLCVLSTPGHSPGGVCYYDERTGTLFCGDTLFHGSIGRTDLPGGSLDRLLSSIATKILTLPDDCVCYPGHGPHTTVGAERISNPFLTGDYVV
ncbi:MAG TPA: MBL fold metallo-hydrolase [Candidatus Deferrimicrobium sp.]|nr:MBL fold metallo-hydrolase [Candidatus Deferrimicrobium sp.]